ncbi:MAG: G1 family glutamic endopeptidase [Nocardioidaceae bacterium]
MRKALFAVMVVAAMALAAPANASVVRGSGVHQAPNHKITQSTSSNWAGYAAIGTTFTSVSSSWTQPTASCTNAQTYSSFWVGLDGYSSNSVEQTGTDADCSASGVPSYYAWYEMYPKYPVNLKTRSYPVSPGDHLSASVTFTGRNSFKLTIADSTRGWTFTTSQKSGKAARTSAEVIAEAPSSSSGVLPLTNFGAVSFSGSTANGQPLSTFSPDKIDMVSGTTTKATTGSISGSGAFGVTWVHS